MDYTTASRIIASWLVYANRTLNEVVVPTSQLLHLPLETAHVEIIFQHENPPSSDWVPVCGWVYSEFSRENRDCFSIQSKHIHILISNALRRVRVLLQHFYQFINLAGITKRFSFLAMIWKHRLRQSGAQICAKQKVLWTMWHNAYARYRVHTSCY